MMWELSRKERISRNRAVMAGLVPAIYVGGEVQDPPNDNRCLDVDGRDKPGHDGKGGTLPPHEAGLDAKGGAA